MTTSVHIMSFHIFISERIFSIFSGSGKSFWVYKLIRENDSILATKLKSVIWCYKVLQPDLLQLQKDCPMVKLHEGFSKDVYENLPVAEGQLIVVDDMMTGKRISKIR